MKAVFFPSRDAVTLGDLPDPVAGRGEVLLRVRASGLCHTDIEVMRGNYGTGTYPMVPGHEYAGEVAAVGPGVTGFAPGDRVVVDPNLDCGTCRACHRGWTHLCERLGAYGVTANGGHAELSVVRADRLHRIGTMSFAMAALAEPVGCVINGLSPLEGRIIDTALVFGTGPMGLLMGLALRTRGVDRVLMVDRDPARLDMARAQGLGAVPAGDAVLDELRQGCDLVVDATGVPAVAAGLVDYVANGGAALFFGVCPQAARIEIAPYEVFRRQLTLLGTHSLQHDIPKALTLIAEFGPGLESIVTHRLPLAGLADAIGGRLPTGSMKVQLSL